MRVSIAPCLRVPKDLGEKAISLARKLAILDRDLRVQQVGEQLYVPLVAGHLSEQIKEIKGVLPEFEIESHTFHRRIEQPPKLVDALKGKLPPHLLATVPRSVDFIGEIAIVEIPPELSGYKKTVGERILAMHKRVHTVLAKSGAVKGVYRLREFEVIAGIGKTVTTHREHGCVYHLDLAKVYFSPRLAHEHKRVASQVAEGETVVDMFAGVGPFSVLIAKKRENVKVYAIELNPDAIYYLNRNIYVNHVKGKVTSVFGNARQIIKKKLARTADRIIMNLPEKAMEFLDVACEAIKHEGGIIHYYDFAGAPYPLEEAKSRLIRVIKKTDRDIKEVLSERIVRAIAPFCWQVAVDVEI